MPEINISFDKVSSAKEYNSFDIADEGFCGLIPRHCWEEQIQNLGKIL
ncbi:MULTISPECIES: hypothetical protein [Calothrix]|uniref:Uncharacterized protein n=2 Tax=Calothrix TaxID=1186 RepID=A0ABR8ADL5_9CYAN|nr:MULTISPECIES: hypothetical protein [Calothrix]MBD2197141.1 hypothetical protein [Calothrix parietina FACHB-288]MBD2225787.1 hypothetical protein [Calothrix anomala FACHB-343]